MRDFDEWLEEQYKNFDQNKVILIYHRTGWFLTRSLSTCTTSWSSHISDLSRIIIFKWIRANFPKNRALSANLIHLQNKNYAWQITPSSSGNHQLTRNSPFLIFANKAKLSSKDALSVMMEVVCSISMNFQFLWNLRYFFYFYKDFFDL